MTRLPEDAVRDQLQHAIDEAFSCGMSPRAFLECVAEAWDAELQSRRESSARYFSSVLHIGTSAWYAERAPKKPT